MSLALLVPGAEGQLAADLLDLVRFEHNAFARGLTVEGLDVTDPFAVKDMVALWARLLRSDSPDHQLVVINAAVPADLDSGARADVDEDDAYAVEALAPALLAQACAAAGARLLHVSTAEVFAGDRDGPPYDVDDPTGPTNAYGRTKLAGEQAVRELHPDGGYVVRTAWLYGAGGANIVKTMARLERERDTVAFVADQHGSPTWSRDLAAGLIALARSQAPAGTYHCTNTGETTWHGLAQAVFAELGADPARVAPSTTADYPTPASRPAYSVLSPRAWEQAGLPAMRGWREALTQAFATSGDAFRAAPTA